MTTTALQTRVRKFFGELQDEICAGLTRIDGQGQFKEDRWNYRPAQGEDDGGGGRTRIFEGGRVFEKGGVNLSEVRGELSELLAKRLGVEARGFYATGVSLVLHPHSPMVPTVHMNVRYLQLAGEDAPAWFGGGADLTPYYLFEEDAVHFHRCWKDCCDRHDPAYYAEFKKQCDGYFFNKHRGEARGIGGIFFDYLKQDLEQVFSFVQDVGKTFLPAYLPVVERRQQDPFTTEQKDWQLVRRGRYVEFNLIHDRGTLFGLETGGRTESILMSLPPVVHWRYDHHPAAGSAEERLVETLRQPRDWLA